MHRFFIKPLMIILAVWSALLTSGCASGGFKLTRQYAGFVNRQDLIIRIILYILTGVVFVATLLIDMVIFNTMDFWDGRVSEGTYEFNKDGKTYVAHHRFQPGTSLRESRIEISGPQGKNQLILRETAKREIDVIVDGVLKGKVSDISSLPLLSLYNGKGEKLQTRPLFPQSVASAR